MTMETTGAPVRAEPETDVHHDAPYSDARASILEKGFIWIAWALAAAFIAFTMSLYFPGFLASDPEPDPAQAPPASVANPIP